MSWALAGLVEGEAEAGQAAGTVGRPGVPGTGGGGLPFKTKENWRPAIFKRKMKHTKKHQKNKKMYKTHHNLVDFFVFFCWWSDLCVFFGVFFVV